MTAGLTAAKTAGLAARARHAAAGRSAFAYCLAVYLAVRAGLFMVGALAVGFLPLNAPAPVPGWPAPPLTPGWHNMVTAWERWDALWYLRIADTGYSAHDGSAAFFPGYPMLTRVVSVITGGHPLLGAYLISNGALIVGLYLLYRLTELEFDVATARRTVGLLAVFPTALFLFAPYSESLFLALSVGALLAARRSRWVSATALGALATATRSIGVVLALALAVEAVRQHVAVRRAAPPWQGWLGGVAKGAAVGLGSCLGIVGYLAWWRARTGDALMPFDAQHGWDRHFSWPWATLWDGLHLAWSYIGITNGAYHTTDALIVLLALAAGVWVVVRTPMIYRVYTAASLLFPLFLIFPGRPLMSMPRFVVVIVPLFWAFARFTRRWNALPVTVGCFAAGLGVLSLLFADWYWVF